MIFFLTTISTMGALIFVCFDILKYLTCKGVLDSVYCICHTREQTWLS